MVQLMGLPDVGVHHPLPWLGADGAPSCESAWYTLVAESLDQLMGLSAVEAPGMTPQMRGLLAMGACYLSVHRETRIVISGSLHWQ